jgi:hypothetical protein
MAHLLYFSSFCLSPFLMVISTCLKILYSFLYRKCINYIHLHNFFLLPSSSPLWPAFAWPVFSEWLYLYWVYIPHMRENMWLLSCSRLTLLKMMFSSCIHLPVSRGFPCISKITIPWKTHTRICFICWLLLHSAIFCGDIDNSM